MAQVHGTEKSNSRRREQALVWAMTAIALALLIVALIQLKNNNATVEKKNGYGVLGMAFLDLQDKEEMASYHVSVPGVYVLAVDEGSQAASLGVCSGDRVLSVGGEALRDANHLESLVGDIKDPTTIRLSLIHSGEQEPYEIEIELSASH